MNKRNADGQSGQTLIHVALAMVALLAFLALAVDVGNLYGERRHMQNAADAGALAGARDLCFGSGNPEQARIVADEYATVRNRAEVADVQIVGGIVTVEASEDAPTFFAGALAAALGVAGLDSTRVEATAAAACGGVSSACGLWPVALEEDRWEDLASRCGMPFFLWQGDNPNNIPDCTVCNCDVIGEDGFNDIVAQEGRAWLDFTDVVLAPDDYNDPCYDMAAGNCGLGTNELKCWVESTVQARVPIPSCVRGLNGTRAALQKPVNARAGDIIGIPIFSGKGCAQQGECPLADEELTYWVDQVGCISVIGWRQKLELPYAGMPYPPAPGSVCWADKTIEVSVSCTNCQTNCGTTTGEIPPDWAMRAVSLIQ